MKTIQLTLTEEEAIVLRDAATDKFHELKNAPSERGRRLAGIIHAIAYQLRDQISR